MMKKYEVNLTVADKKDSVRTMEVASEEEAIRFAVGTMKLRYHALNSDLGYFVYSIKEI